jgi:hypothetical protein
MRCDEVIRELAVPTAGRDDRTLAQHLARCETCARWADRARKLDRLWDATRPADPGAQTWDSLWSSVAANLDQPATSSGNGSHPGPLSESKAKVLSFPGSSPETVRARPWVNVAAIGMIGLAQAAALMLAVGLSGHAPVEAPATRRDLHEVASVAPEPAPRIDAEIEVGEGRVALIRSAESKVEVVDLPAQEKPGGTDRWYWVYNQFESFSMSEIELEEGHIAVIRSDGAKVEVVDLAAQEMVNLAGRWFLDPNEVVWAPAAGSLRSRVDQWYLLHDVFEGMAGSSVLAME